MIRTIPKKPNRILACIAMALLWGSVAHGGTVANLETLSEAATLDAGRGVAIGELATKGLDGAGWVYRVLPRRNTEFGALPPDPSEVVVVFAAQPLADKQAAWDALKVLGLPALIERDQGSVVILTPRTARWTDADAATYNVVERLLFTDREFGLLGPPYASGSSGLFYAIGLDAGADFFNTYIATAADHAGRYASALLVRPSSRGLQPAVALPAFLVDASPGVVQGYAWALGATVHGTDRQHRDQYANPLPGMQARRVLSVPAGRRSATDLVAEGYSTLLRHTQRVAMGINRDYMGDSPPFALWTHGTTEERGLRRIEPAEDFAGQQQRRQWMEWVPEELLRNPTQHSAALLLSINFAEGSGWLDLAAREKLIIFSPGWNIQAGALYPDRYAELIALLDHVIAKYPQIDPARVYMTGFSVGGITTSYVGLKFPAHFAALAPTGAVTGPNVRLTDLVLAVHANQGKYRMPIFMLTNSQDSTYGPTYRRYYSTWNGNRSETIAKPFYDQFHLFNNMEVLADEQVNFNRYEYFGVPLDFWGSRVCGDLSFKSGYEFNSEHVPMLEFGVIEKTIHNVFPCYAEQAWAFLSQFSRDPETGELRFHPNGSVH
jgi:hypothetical protein